MTRPGAAAIDPADLEACRAAIRHGSKSFHAASRLLPARVRDPALALYAFCRLADDAVDLNVEKPAAVLSLHDRLDRAYAGRPVDSPADRAFAAMVAAHAMPRALPEALLEGFAWDAVGRRYASLSELRAYSARVAAAVGAMMTVLMGVRDADALARACDLGVAMQLTNIARDVGEDAAEGRLYLPLDWLGEAGIDPAAFLAAPAHSPALAGVVRRLLDEARRLYLRAEPGIAALPPGARPAIFAARLIYDEIGAVVRGAGCDSVTRRAVSSNRRKLALAAQALLRAGATSLAPRSPILHAPPLPETAFLVAAAASPPARPAAADHLAAIFADLRRRDAARVAALGSARALRA
jgi:phytoene synthase